MILNVCVTHEVSELEMAQAIVDDITSYAYCELGLDTKELSVVICSKNDN